MLLQRFVPWLLPVLFLVFTPGDIMMCRMGMRDCAHCCPQMVKAGEVLSLQVKAAKTCCTVLEKQVAPASFSLSAKDFLSSKQILKKVEPWNHSFLQDPSSVASLLPHPVQDLSEPTGGISISLHLWKSVWLI